MNRTMLSYSHPRRSPRVLGSLFAAAFLAVATAAHAGNGPVAMPVTKLIKGATLVGPMPPSLRLNMSISLAPPNPKAFQAYASSVSNRRSPNYHKFLTPAQIGTQFGPSMTTVNATVNYLKSKGMTIRMIADNHMAILFGGTVAQAESAFTTKLNRYHLATRADKGSKDFFYYSVTPTVPTTFSSSVMNIGGLQNAYLPRFNSTLKPSQSRQLYDAANLYAGGNGVAGRQGSGINIGVTSHDGYLLSNLPLFYNAFNLPVPAGGVGSNVHKILVNGSDGEQFPAEGETDLDMQMILTTAPLCNLYIYDGVSFTDPSFVDNDYVATLAKIANDNIVDVISDSTYIRIEDDTASTIEAMHVQFEAIATEGISYLSASGDFGTNATATGSTDDNSFGVTYPEADPFVTVVGGTVATVDANGNRLSEDGWVGSGSGWSVYPLSFNQVLPDFQVGSGVPTSIPHRLIPDVALHASGANLLFSDPNYDTPDGSNFAYFIFSGGQENVESGTSASSPLFAGQLGVILEDLTASGSGDLASNGRVRLSNLNSFIYGLNGQTSAFLDILTGDTGVLPNGQEAVGHVGWDFVTGWGAPDVVGLRDQIAAASGVVPMDDLAVSAALYTQPSPTLTLGTAPQGDFTDLASADGSTYSVQSVTQNGVGQVAAATVGFSLQGASANRRSLSMTAAVTSPALTVAYVYIKNVATGNYDLMNTVIGDGTMKSVTFSVIGATDLAKYVDGSNNVTVLVRSTKPARLGGAPFRLSIDQLSAIERIKPS